MCIEQEMVMTATEKCSVKLCPKSHADSTAVKTVARVLEYFLSTVSAYLQPAAF